MLNFQAPLEATQSMVWLLTDDRQLLSSFEQYAGDRSIPWSRIRAGELDSSLRQSPGCLLLDCDTYPEARFSLIRQSRSRGPRNMTLLIGSDFPAPVVADLMRQGIDGVLEKPLDPLAFEAELELASSVAKLRAAVCEQQWQARERIALLPKLERDILALVSAGTPNKNIAARLQLAMRTVEKYRRSLFDLLGVESAAEATRMHVLATLPNLYFDPPQDPRSAGGPHFFVAASVRNPA